MNMDTKKKNPTMKLDVDIHSFILSVIQQIFIGHPPCISRHCANTWRAEMDWSLWLSEGDKANGHTGEGT